MVIHRRIAALVGATALTGGLAVGASIAVPGVADATACTGLTAALGSCTTLGTATLTGGGLAMVSPTLLAWNGQLTGSPQTLYDTNTATGDTALYVLDLRGLLTTNAASGWNITASATPFTGTVTGKVIPDNGTGEVLAFGGGGTAGTASAVPSSVCVTVGTCTPASDTLSAYPLSVPTSSAATPPATTVYIAGQGTGSGIVQVGNSALATGANPAVWSVSLPAATVADAYTSTITMTVAAGP